jgi:transcriptional regulator with XRE-family HTH domain
MRSLSEQLRTAIKRDGRSSFELEMETGVARNQITRFLNRERSLTLPTVDKLARALGLTFCKVAIVLLAGCSGCERPMTMNCCGQFAETGRVYWAGACEIGHHVLASEICWEVLR